MKNEFGEFNVVETSKKASVYTIENEHIILKVTDYGAALVSLIDKETGIDVAFGYDKVSDYDTYRDAHMGASIGRTANRIEKGTFVLNGKVYHTPCNNNGNSLHGKSAFDTKIWMTVEGDSEIIFRYVSPDGEEGFPGNLYVKVTYRLLDRGVAILSEGTADKDTLFAYTNHSYFNLDQSEDAMQHVLQIPSDRYALTDHNGLTMDRMEKVSGTPFDFRHPKKIGRDIEKDDAQLKCGNGYDHYFDIDGEGMRPMAYVKGKKLAMTMESDFPGFHLYTSNFLTGQMGKYGMHYGARSAFCLEAEYYPNGINYADIKDKPIVKAGTTLSHEIRYILKTI